MRKALLALLLWLAPVVLSAQTMPPSRLSSGSTLPAACAYGSIWYKTSGIIGFYDCATPTTGWRFTGSVLPTLQVGNNSPSLTGPISYLAGNHAFSGAIGSTQMFGLKWYTTWNSSNAMTAVPTSAFIYGDIVGTQAASEAYGTFSQMNASTTGLVGKMEGLRSIVTRFGGDLSTGRGFSTYAIYDGAAITAVDHAGMEIYSPLLLNGAGMNIGRNILLPSPPQSGGTLNFWRGLGIGDQSTPLTDNSLAIEVNEPNGGYLRLWDNGALDSFPIITATELKIGGTGQYQPAHRFQAFVTPQADNGKRYTGVDAELYVEDKISGTVQGAEVYAELDGAANVTGSLMGIGIEYGHYSSATVPMVYGAFVAGGNGGGGTITDLHDIHVDPMWDTSATTLTRTGLYISPIVEGSVSNYAMRYVTATGGQAGISGGGASFDAPEAQSFGATVTLTPATSSVRMTCTNAGGCAVTLGETGVQDGQVVRFVNVSANTCNFADTPGLTELAGAFAAGQWDTLALQYITDRWVELSRSNN